MFTLRSFVLCLCAAALIRAQPTPPDVGTGAPNDAIRARFVQAYFRGGFAQLVAMPPLADVRRFGATGLIQEFQDAARTPNTRLALVKANTNSAIAEETIDVFQVTAAMNAYHGSVGVNTAGYPTMDTAACPPVAGNSCVWQLFDRSHGLFAFDRATLNGQNFTLRDPFYTRWTAIGGNSVLGPATSAEEAATSSTSAIAATRQTYANGAIYNITSGVLNGRIVTIRQPVWDLYGSQGAHAAFLGLPTADETIVSGGRRRQSFEGGAIEYEPGGVAVLRLPVSGILLSAAATLRLNPGDTLTVTARAIAANGVELPDRTFAWSTTNARVVSVQPGSASAVLRATGGGSATVTATSEGRSNTIAVFVTAPCCQVGEGAPTAAIRQAFEDSVRRNRLAVKLPAAASVRRLGAGHVQELQPADETAPVRFLVAMSDRSAAAYVLTGALLDRYEALGGPAGSLGFPQSDATAGGRQLFENSAALAGSPVRLVTGTLLARWAVLGYETGMAGLPVSDPAPFFTFAGTRGQEQAFARGVLHGALTGAQSGRVYFVGGLVLDKYRTMNGAAGQFGMPVGEEFSAGGKRHQDFEGGYIEYAPGDTEATATETGRRPTLTSTPSTVVAGSRVRITAGGFDTGATLRVSASGAPIGGQPDFFVKTENGAHTWETYIRPDASPGAVIVRASDANGSAVAQGGYIVRAQVEARLTLAKARGDAQTGLPGSVLPIPLRIALRDEAGNPMPGAPVRFEASPGARIAAAAAVTDERGEAEATLRLPAAQGVALATAEAGRQIVTFSARVAASTLANYPRQLQAGENGALAAALSSMLRFHQNRGELPSPNGPADPAALSAYLKSFCVFDAQGFEICDGFVGAGDAAQGVVNPWRAGVFAGGGVEATAERSDVSNIRDLLGEGAPVLLSLALTVGDAPAGAHTVVAIGVAADAGIVIHDPNAAWARSRLAEYLTGFTAGGRVYNASLISALRLRVRPPSATGFLVTAAGATIQIESLDGACGMGFETQDAAGRPLWFRYCDGAAPVYQLEVLGAGAFRGAVTDLASPGFRTEFSGRDEGAFKLTRPLTHWVAAPQDAAVLSVVNSGSLTPDLAPGSLARISGSGLSRAGGATVVEVAGVPSAVLSATPFLVVAQIPLDLAPGAHTLSVKSGFGTAGQPIEIDEVAPAILTVDGRRAAVSNQNATLNQPTNPARRGQVIAVYAIGLGAVGPDGRVLNPVTVAIGDSEVAPEYAGLTAGFIGLYQVNLTLPSSITPGLDLRLTIRQRGASSQAVEISVE